MTRRGLRRVARQNRRDAQLEARVDREAHVALAREERFHGGMVRVVAMPQDRHEIAVIAPDGPRLLAVAAGDSHRRLVVVEAAQSGFAVALDERRVAGAPIRARRQIAEQVEPGSTERVTSRAAIGARRGQRDTNLVVRRSGLCQRGLIVAGDGQPLAVEDRPLRNLPRGIQHARIVLIPARPVGLYPKMRSDRDIVGAKHLDAHQSGNQDHGHGAKGGAQPPHRRTERRQIGRRRSIGSNRGQQSQSGEVGDHGGTAEAEERRHDTRERHEAQHAGRHQQDRRGEAQRENRRQEEAVVRRRANGSRETAPQQRQEERRNREEAAETEVLADRGKHEVGVARRQIPAVAETGPCTPRTSGGDRPEGVRDLVAAAGSVVPKRLPHAHAIGERRGNVEAIPDVEPGAQQG